MSPLSIRPLPAALLLAGAIAAAPLLAACRSTPAPEPAPVPPDTWATVAGRPITREQVEKEYRRMSDPSATLSDEETLTAKLGVLEDLVVEEILLAKAVELKIELMESEIEAAYADARGSMPDEAFQQELSRRKITAQEMRDGVRRELLARKVLDREVVSKITVTDQEVSAFFDANRAQFNLPEDAYHLAQIVVTPARDPQVRNRTGDDAATPQAAAAKVSMIMERLKSGTPFGDLARDYSEDPESAPRGGDLGLVPLSAVTGAPPPLRDAVLQMTPGSARAVTQGGVTTIAYLVAREPAGQRDLSTPAVRERITEGLRSRREQLLRVAYITAARTDTDVVNYLARRVVESQGRMTGAGGSAGAAGESAAPTPRP
jgi:peptidyl-prolyl cis-trans isomerase SurA